MKNNYKNHLLFCLYAIIIGLITGLIIWSFLKIMNLSINFIWNFIPNNFEIPFYTIIICTIGGLIIGLWQKKYPNYPEDLNQVIKKVKQDGGYPYKNIKAMSVSAILPLVFGGSIGPEAGLTGIIAGLCTWVGDRFKHLFKEMKELTSLGISASLGTIFNSPMFGFTAPIENEDEKLPKKAKIVLSFLAIFSSLSIFFLLNHLFGKTAGLASFNDLNIGFYEWIWLFPLSIIGMFVGYLYFMFHHLINNFSNKFSNVVLKCIIAGLLLGIIGTLLPYTMFSGEHQMAELMNKFTEMGVVILLIIGIAKLLLTNICVIMGFKGGHFFPVIFAGVSIGFAFSLLTGIDATFSVSIITTALLSCIMQKPLATVLLLMIIFPVEAIPTMIFAACIGSITKHSNI